MKVLLLNGSPRKGNTYTALEAVKKGLENAKDVQIKEIVANDVNVSPCIACEGCGRKDGCVFDDDTREVVDSVVEADAIVFATPVYWWGITAQLKLIIDKLYSKGSVLGSGKKIGIIVTGEAEQEDPQYQIITKQFECICDYLGWDMAFVKTYSAADPDELGKQDEAMAELEAIGKILL